MAEYSEEEIERMVEESKTIQAIVDFSHAEGVTESLEYISEAIVVVAEKFRADSDLGTPEVVAALLGTFSAVLAHWVIEVSKDDPDDG